MFRKNAANQNLPFSLVYAANGAALTGLGANVSAYRSLDGGAQANCTGTITEKGNGQYNLALSQADTNANQAGYLLIAANAIPVHFSISTTAADPQNANSFGLSTLDANVSSRSTYSGGAVASVTNIPANGSSFTALGDARLTHLDANVSSASAPTVGQIDTQLSGTHGAGAWGAVSGAGNVSVNHDTGGTDNLRYVTSGGVGINNGLIEAYFTSDYTSGKLGVSFVQGTSKTGVDGRWLNNIELTSGFSYTLVFSVQGQFNPSTAVITI